MKLFCIFAAFCFIWANVQAVEDNTLAALRECGNLHNLEFRNIPDAKAEYSNSNCNLTCSIGSKVLSSDTVNQAFPCPLNANGICKNGQCIVEDNHDSIEAQRECSNMHHIDFHTNNGSQSFFSNAGCFLKCFLKGQAVSENNLNEGFTCPQNPTGICKNGHCVWPVTTSPTIEPTTQKSVKSVLKIDKILVRIESADLASEFTHLSAAMCIESRHDFTHFNQCSRATCLTANVYSATRHPVWDRNCYMTGPYTEHDFITVGLYQYQNGVTYHYLGAFNQDIHSLFLSRIAMPQEGSHFVTFEDKKMSIFNSSQQAGDFYLIFNFTLSVQ